MSQNTPIAAPRALAVQLARALNPARRRAIFHGLVLGGWLFVFLIIPKLVEGQLWGRDAIAYWSVDVTNPYRGAVDQFGYFPYAPPTALFASLFKLLPWTLFLVGWTALQVAVLAWIGGGLRSLVVLLAIPVVFLEVLYGNIHVFLGAAVVLGFRWPVLWSFVLLTKVTPGVGLLWFAMRREWRSLAFAVGATGAIALGSFVIAPDLWSQWVRSLIVAQTVDVPWGHAIAIPLPIRLGAAVALVAWGAWTNRRWTVVVASTLALPVLWTAGVSMLVALVALRSDERAESRDSRPAKVFQRGRTGWASVGRSSS